MSKIIYHDSDGNKISKTEFDALKSISDAQRIKEMPARHYAWEDIQFEKGNKIYFYKSDCINICSHCKFRANQKSGIDKTKPNRPILEWNEIVKRGLNK